MRSHYEYDGVFFMSGGMMLERGSLSTINILFSV
jgi:hypothetical protein